MRKLTFAVSLLILVCILAGCRSSKEIDVSSLKKSTYDSSQQSKDVTLAVKEKNITPEVEVITLVFNNLSSKEYIYGEEPHLEMNAGGVWYVVPTLDNIGWNDIGYILSPNKAREAALSIKNNYGKLNSGSYRLIKKLFSNGKEIFSIAEFEIR